MDKVVIGCYFAMSQANLVCDHPHRKKEGHMHRYLFTFLVIQDGKLDETIQEEISFDSPDACVAAIVAHAAQQSRVPTVHEVFEIWAAKSSLGSMLSRGPQKGFGPWTNLIIKSAIRI